MACTSTKFITLSSGAVSLKLEFIDPLSVSPDFIKNFTSERLGDNTIVYDVAGSPKKRWTLRIDVPLTTSEKADLDTLYALTSSITLTEDFLESSTVFSVFFERKEEEIESFAGDKHFVLILQQV